MEQFKLKNSIPILVWLAIYPALLYYAIMYILSTLCAFFAGNILNVELTEEVKAVVLLVSSIATIPFMFSVYANDRNAGLGISGYLREHKPSVSKQKIKIALFAAVIVIVMGFALNNLIGMTPLIRWSEGYRNANANLYSGSMAVILMRSAFFVPILEELTFRGIVQFRMSVRLHRIWAILIAALLFAVMHMNVVQSTYAFFLGIVLGIICDHVGHIYPAVIGHMAVNAVTVLRVQFQWLPSLSDGSASAWLISLGILCFGIAMLFLFVKIPTDSNQNQILSEQTH
ncbi:MAG: CPBP family intramembrane metalloprotease [Agathobacter sp.]|uniref:CPBP family intramembrane glutamic endopeptidase n=1 Tax=Agathobacter sp. TaxID=2021311 RepID=UPI002588EB9F|nr:CPBP family intramembrane glutamic endopeptidase [Agathobacter sp.]MCR5678363.1 CPBP family intramembrane metalloprotease [Agathobacter sp.]